MGEMIASFILPSNFIFHLAPFNRACRVEAQKAENQFEDPTTTTQKTLIKSFKCLILLVSGRIEYNLFNWKARKKNSVDFHLQSTKNKYSGKDGYN